ncbi:MAG: single-stranded DNA-binding protein [Deltaproteobacteria bacterium]|nr:single-stranded DNA-binding protein [Deltaproteobacteria bacterium]
MSANVNKVILVGNLGADPDLRHTSNGTAVCELRLATNESWTDKDGKKQERTEWHRLVAWDKLGEICAEHLSKGRQIFVEGRLRTRKWEDKDGNDRWTTEIVAKDVQFLGSKDDGGSGGGGSSSSRSDDDAPPSYNGGSVDDIPF